MVDGLFFVGPPEAELELRRLCDSQKYPQSKTDVYQFKKAVFDQVPTCSQTHGQKKPPFRPQIRDQGWDIFREDTHEDQLQEWLLEQYGSQEELDILCTWVRKVNPRLDRFQVYTVLAAIYSGALVVGAAGTGKSEVLRTIHAFSQESNEHSRVCAYTHAATRLVGGETIAHLLYLNTQLADTTFLIDEVGLLPVSTLGAISRWQVLGAKFICFGDYCGQFEPFRDRWNMSHSADYSPLMHELCGGLRIELTTYRRGRDPDLFDWYHGLYKPEQGGKPIRVLVEGSRERYHAACDRACDPLVLCVSHAKRMIINTRQNELLKPDGSTFLEWSGANLVGATMQPQSMWIYKGLELIGCPRGTGTKLVVQGVLYIVTDITATAICLRMRAEYCKDPEELADDEKAEVALEDACSMLRLSHASCYYTVQGRTVKDRHIVLLDTSHPYFTVRSLIVGLSRGTHGCYLHIGDSGSEGLFVGERRVRSRVIKSRDLPS
jgi:hypothetical protein